MLGRWFPPHKKCSCAHVPLNNLGRIAGPLTCVHPLISCECVVYVPVCALMVLRLAGRGAASRSPVHKTPLECPRLFVVVVGFSEAHIRCHLGVLCACGTTPWIMLRSTANWHPRVSFGMCISESPWSNPVHQSAGAWHTCRRNHQLGASSLCCTCPEQSAGVPQLRKCIVTSMRDYCDSGLSAQLLTGS